MQVPPLYVGQSAEAGGARGKVAGRGETFSNQEGGGVSVKCCVRYFRIYGCLITFFREVIIQLL